MAYKKRGMASSLSGGLSMSAQRIDDIARMIELQLYEPERLKLQITRLRTEAENLRSRSCRRIASAFAHGELKALVLTELADGDMTSKEVHVWARQLGGEPISVINTMYQMARQGHIQKLKGPNGTVFKAAEAIAGERSLDL